MVNWGWESTPASREEHNTIHPLWTAPLPVNGSGLLTTEPAGGCIATAGQSVATYTSGGRRAWEAPAPARSYGGQPILTPDGTFVRIENDEIVARDAYTGEHSSSFPAPLGSGLCLAPWGDLLYSAAAPGGTASVQCVRRTGEPRWSVSLDDSTPLLFPPLALGNHVVLVRRGALWAFDSEGHAVWLADQHGVRIPSPEDEAPRPNVGEEAGSRLEAAPARIDAERVVVELSWYSGRGMYFLDSSTPSLTPFAVPSPVLSPHTLLRDLKEEDKHRIIGTCPVVPLNQFDREYPVAASEADGTRLWEHRLPAKPRALTPTPQGGVLVTATVSPRQWQDYEQWCDLSAETFVRCLSSDGVPQWTWHAPGPITHMPVVGSTGVAYVGCREKLWAFPTSAQHP